MKLIKIYFYIWLAALVTSCAAYKPVKVDFNAEHIPSPPDYSNINYWSALPDKKDSADNIPADSPIELFDGQASAAVDVFYIYPTQFYSRDQWNADLMDQDLNKSIDARAVKNQATVFNGSCKIYIPRYRQATYNSYNSLTDPGKKLAFDLAYSDVKNAFQYYLDNYNKGRPIIIAAHSQGTTHAKNLLKDFLDDEKLQHQLVCAYLLGVVTFENEFQNIPPCENPGQTGCFISWRTFLEGEEADPGDSTKGNDKIAVINPITFTRDKSIITTDGTDGILGRDSETIYDPEFTVQIHNSIIWVSRPDIPGKLFIPKNLHIADYNLFWLSIRENVAVKVENYLRKN